MLQRLLRLALAPVLLLALLLFAGFGEEYPDLSPQGDAPQEVQGIDMDALRECINGIGGDVPGDTWRCSSVVTDAAAATDSGVIGDNLRECLNTLWRGAPGNLLKCTLVVTDLQATLGDPIDDVADNLQECLNRISGLRPGHPRWGSHMSLCPNRLPPALIPYPDLTATKINLNAPGGVPPYDESTFTGAANDITITNQGDLPAGPFVVTDILDARVGANIGPTFYVLVNTDPTGGVTCTLTGALPPLGGFQCTFANGLGVGQSVLIWFDFIWDSTCTPAERAVGSYTAGNSVTADTPIPGGVVLESDETNNVGTETYQVNCLLPDLSITKSDTPDPVNAGADLTYTLVVTNVGTVPAVGVVVTDTLDAEAVFVIATVGCVHDGSASGGVVTCTIPFTMNPADVVNLTILVTANPVPCPPGVETITDTATVASSLPDANPADNTAIEDTIVTCGPE